MKEGRCFFQAADDRTEKEPANAEERIHCDSGASERSHPLNVLLLRLDEQQRRWVAAWESKNIGYGGDTLIAQITGLHVDTIRRGREELDADLEGRPIDR